MRAQHLIPGSFILLLIGGAIAAKLLSEGGTDTLIYSDIKYFPPIYWGWYHLQNLASWMIIYTSFKATDGLAVGYTLLILDCIVWGAFFLFSKSDNSLRIVLIPLALFSASGALLSYNILRQYISVVFFLIASIRFFQKRGAWSSPFFVLSMFSHFSILPFVFAVLLSRYNFNKRIYRTLLFPAVYLIITFVFLRFQPEKFLLASDHHDTSLELYAFGLVSFLLLLIFWAKKHFCWARSHQSEKLDELGRFIFYSFAALVTLSLSSAPIWLINRFWISFIFIISAFILATRTERVPGARPHLEAWFKGGTFLFIFLTLFLHPGASQMVGLF